MVKDGVTGFLSIAAASHLLARWLLESIEE
jgi:hypothetical protein